MIPLRPILLAISLLVAPASASIAIAAEEQRFDAATFAAAKTAGKPILVEVTASWCPVCKAQKPILAELTKAPRFKDLVILQVDFDSRKDILKTLGVRMQSTMISYKGTAEVARSTGVTDKAAIAAQLDKAM